MNSRSQTKIQEENVHPKNSFDVESLTLTQHEPWKKLENYDFVGRSSNGYSINYIQKQAYYIDVVFARIEKYLKR